MAAAAAKALNTMEELVEQVVRTIMSNSPEFIATFHVKFLEAITKTK
jgi:hypothetical protein